MPIGSLISGLIGSGGASAAGAAAGAGAGQALTNANNAAESSKSLAAPYIGSGFAATNALLQALGLGHLTPFDQSVGGTTYGYTQLDQSNQAADRANALANFQASPGYDWRVNQGTTALDRSAASRGMLLSGAQNKAISDYGQNQASAEWGNYINQLMALSGQGAGSAASAGNQSTAAYNSGNALSNTDLLGQAAGYSNSANALASGISGAVNGLGGLIGYGLGGGFGGGGISDGAQIPSPAGYGISASVPAYNALTKL
jgi:hypothetical protein